MIVHKFTKIIGVIGLAALVLGGCRAEEQGRITSYEPGVYKGKPDTELSDAQRRVLRQRSVYQGSSVVAGGGGTSPKYRDVRKPAASSVDLSKLKNRARLQAGSGTN